MATATPLTEATSLSSEAENVPIAELVEELGTASRLPNLSLDVAALLALLFTVITYHIQHPFLLFRVEFGQTFRDVQEQGFQQAMVYGLLASVFLLIGARRNLIVERDTLTRYLRWGVFIGYGLALWRGSIADPILLGVIVGGLLLSTLWQQSQSLERLQIALIIGVAIYILHITFVIFRDYNIFLDSYHVKPEDYADVLQMTRSQAALYPDAMKALNTMALLVGSAFAALIYLWSPWQTAQTLPLTLAKHGFAIITLAAGLVCYRLIHPVWASNSLIANELSALKDLAGIVLLLSVLGLVFTVWRGQTTANKRLLGVLVAGVGLYVAYVAAALWADYNAINAYYDVQPALYNDLLAREGILKPLKIADLSAFLGGIGLISVIYIWSPWERLDLYRRVVRGNITALIVAVLAVLAWEYGVKLLHIQQFLLPRPSAIWEKFKEIYPGLIAGSWFTVKNAIQGFALGCGAGVLTGTLSARFTNFSRAILPLAIAANAIPIIAFAPIANAWFGLTSTDSKVAIVALLCYFPAMISTVQGLNSVQERELELMKSYAATEFEIFRHLRLPTALPFIFSALKLAATLAMIGAVVAEFFGGTPATALGFTIKNNAGLLRMTESWSAIIVASVLGIGFFLFISALERNAMPWYRAFRANSK